MSNLLYIGLNGFAGSGKDTVAKMIKTILSYDWKTLEDCKQYYMSIYTSPTISATYNDIDNKDEKLPVYCVAFADQLKTICSNIFGIPVKRFYQNKSNAWICMNKDFQYTEIPPHRDYIVTAEEYCNNIAMYKSSDDKYWMSLREILVYIGTYVLQQDINKNIFVNIVKNLITDKQKQKQNLKYVILTDIRFNHEINYIHNNNGITISIVRDGVVQLDNVAEHDLDEEDRWDYVITNNGTYDELFEKIWNLLHEKVEFQNIVKPLITREQIDNYLRLVGKYYDESIYKLCTQYDIQQMYKNDGATLLVDPIGGPLVEVNKEVDLQDGETHICTKIDFDTLTNKYLIYLT
jgi:dephospho-CoA kinase